MPAYNQRITLPFKSDLTSSLINRLHYGVMPRGIYGDFTIEMTANNGVNSILLKPGVIGSAAAEPMVAIFSLPSAGTSIRIEYPSNITVTPVTKAKPWLVLRYNSTLGALFNSQESELLMVARVDEQEPLDAYDEDTDLILAQFYFNEAGDIIETHYDSTHQLRYSMQSGKRLDTWMQVRTVVADADYEGEDELKALHFTGGTVNIDGKDYVVQPEDFDMALGAGTVGLEFGVWLDTSAVLAETGPTYVNAAIPFSTPFPLLFRYKIIVTEAAVGYADVDCVRIPCPRYINSYEYTHPS